VLDYFWSHFWSVFLAQNVIRQTIEKGTGVDLATFVTTNFTASPCNPKRAGLASGQLALDSARVSALIEQWRAISNKALPITYDEFCAVLSGSLLPSESILRGWERLPMNRHPVPTPALKAHLLARSDDLLTVLSLRYENEAKRILGRFSGRSPSPRLYAQYLFGAGRDVRRAFFRKWSLPLLQGENAAHGYIAAGSGFGKSELIKALVFDRIIRHEGVLVLDPHGEMAEQIARWPEVARSGRLVYIDPYIAGPNGDITPVITPLNPLKHNPYKEAAVSYLIECLRSVVDNQEFSQRMETLLKTVLPALSHKEQPTLFDLVDIMAPQPAKRTPDSDDPSRGMLGFIRQHSKENAASFDFIEKDFLSPGYNVTREAIRGRLQYLLSSLTFQRIMGCAEYKESTINLRQEMDRGAIIIVNLASQKLGSDVSADLGKFLLSTVFSAAMSRQDLQQIKPKACFAYLDEADAYLNESVSDIYAQARKYGLFLTVAQQVPGAGMNSLIQSQVFGNSGIRIAGNSGDPASLALLASITRTDEAVIQDLRRGEFLFYSASSQYRATVRRDLIGERHAISEAEWETVRANQIALYYRNHVHPGLAQTKPSENQTMRDRRNPDL
jgi:hypothetical protein